MWYSIQRKTDAAALLTMFFNYKVGEGFNEKGFDICHLFNISEWFRSASGLLSSFVHEVHSTQPADLSELFLNPLTTETPYSISYVLKVADCSPNWIPIILLFLSLKIRPAV